MVGKIFTIGGAIVVGVLITIWALDRFGGARMSVFMEGVAKIAPWLVGLLAGFVIAFRILRKRGGENHGWANKPDGETSDETKPDMPPGGDHDAQPSDWEKPPIEEDEDETKTPDGDDDSVDRDFWMDLHRKYGGGSGS